MGLEISKNEEGKYQLISTNDNQKIHNEEWISEEEAKRILIYRKLWTFIEDTIEIDMSFPHRYRVNGTKESRGDKPDFNKWILDAYESKDVDNEIQKKFEEVYNRLKLDFKIP